MAANESWRTRLSIVVFLIAITWTVFGQTFHHQFINYDDPLYVYDNLHVRAGLSWPGITWAFTHVHSQNWHPITTISHMLDCQLFGVNPGPHHLVNVFWHSVAVMLLFILLNQMTGRVWPSAAVAAVFAIHPLRVESVAWIAERKDVLSGTFFVLTLLSYLRWTRKPMLTRYLTTTVLFACGLMSKPMLVTTPLVLLLLDYWPLGRWPGAGSEEQGPKRQGQSGKGRAGILSTSQPLNLSTSDRWSVVSGLVLEKIPLFALSAGSVVATLWAQNFALGSTEFLPLQWRITNAIFSYFEYVRQMFWPVNLIPFYVHPENRLEIWRLVIAIVFLIAVTAIAFVRRRQNPYLIVGWLWYLVMLVPVIGIDRAGVPAITWTGTDRYHGEYCFNLGNGGLAEEAALMAAWIRGRGYRTVGMIHEISPGGVEYASNFRWYAARAGLDVLIEAYTTQVPEDLEGILRKVRDQKPDCLAYLGYGYPTILMAPMFRNLGWDPPRILTTAFQFCYAKPEWMAALEGWYGIDQMCEDNPRLQPMLDRFAAWHGKRRDHTVTALSYDTARLIAEGLARANLLTPKGVKEGLEKVRMLPAVNGGPRTHMSLGPYDHKAYKGDWLVIRKIEGGRTIFVGLHDLG